MRVTDGRGKVVIVYEWASSPLMKAALRATMTLGALRQMARGSRRSNREPDHASTAPDLYFHPKPRTWFKTLRSRHRARLRVFSTASNTFTRAFFRDGTFGRAMANLVFAGERALQPMAARYGQYPMIVIRPPHATERKESSAE